MAHMRMLSFDDWDVLMAFMISLLQQPPCCGAKLGFESFRGLGYPKSPISSYRGVYLELSTCLSHDITRYMISANSITLASEGQTLRDSEFRLAKRIGKLYNM